MQPEHGVLLIIGAGEDRTIDLRIKLGDRISRGGFLQSRRISPIGSYVSSASSPICATRETGDRTFHAEHALITYTCHYDLIVWNEETQKQGLVWELTQWCKAAI